MTPFKPRAWRASLAVALLLSAAAAADELKIISVATSPDADRVFVAVQFERPADMGDLWIEQRAVDRSRVGLPAMPELSGDPPWALAFYQEYIRGEDLWQRATKMSRLAFVGRCNAAERLNLVLSYPTADGKWKRVPVTLDLTSAEAMRAEPTPLQRWASAQAEWFDVMASTADPTGFFAYGLERTRAKYGLTGRTSAVSNAREARRRPSDRDFEIFSSAVAIEESLQVDRDLDVTPASGPAEIPFDQIEGVSVVSHPFDQMRAGAEPRYSELARLVPENFYYARFGRLDAALELLELGQRWGGSLLGIARPVSRTHRVAERTLEQWCLTKDALRQLADSGAIRELAVIGSDPYFEDGTDVTLILDVADDELFRDAIDPSIGSFEEGAPGALHDERNVEGVPVERLITPDRRLSMHLCHIDRYWIFSNSLEALRRVLQTRAGQRPALADAADFQYMRAVIYPLEEDSEDGFVYLSDPFIRTLVGPEMRIRQSRRIRAAECLRTLSFAGLLFSYRYGPIEPDFNQLVTEGSLDPNTLSDPDGGVFSWNGQDGIARSSTYNQLSFLTPLIELRSARATAAERDAYERFRDRYARYWREFFDPIAVRIHAGRNLRLETCILPLIASSAYDSLVASSGGEPLKIRPAQFSPDTVVRYVFKLSEGPARQSIQGMLQLFGPEMALDWMGEWITLWVEDTDALNAMLPEFYSDRVARRPEPAVFDLLIRSLFEVPLVAGIEVRDSMRLATFLVAARAVINQTAPNVLEFDSLPPYHDVGITRIGPRRDGPLGEYADPQPNGSGGDAASQPADLERSPALFYAIIGDGFYLSTRPGPLRKLVDQTLAERKRGDAAAAGPAIEANALVQISPAAARQARPAVEFVLEQPARAAATLAAAELWMLGRCNALSDERPAEIVSPLVLGYSLACPHGGTIKWEAATRDVVSSVYGPLRERRRTLALPEQSRIRRLLDEFGTTRASVRFTEEGLMASVELERR